MYATVTHTPAALTEGRDLETRTSIERPGEHLNRQYDVGGYDDMAVPGWDAFLAGRRRFLNAARPPGEAGSQRRST